MKVQSRSNNKKIGELVCDGAMKFVDNFAVEINGERVAEYKGLDAVAKDWEDYEPVEPIFDEKIRRGIRAWWDMQDNPFKAAAVLCGKEKDLDGFYHWRIFGYIRDGEQKESTDMCFRTKKLYDYNPSHDYTKEELCGEEGE